MDAPNGLVPQPKGQLRLMSRPIHVGSMPDGAPCRFLRQRRSTFWEWTNPLKYVSRQLWCQGEEIERGSIPSGLTTGKMKKS